MCVTTPRYALYYTPEPNGPLWQLGERVLGPSLAELPGIDAASREAQTIAPRIYGFHATLKAPFRLAEGRGEADLIAALRAFGTVRPPVGPVQLVVTALGHFLALVPSKVSRDLDLLAAEIVAGFEPFRAPLTQDDRTRRLKAGLSPRETALLEAWGYPYVFETFRFHMTLTSALPEDAREAWLAALTPLCGDLLPVFIDAVTLVVQTEPGAPFRAVERVPLRGCR
jgi:hypothetical protein